jgi:SPP1 family predicted phage head-tail adaptor
MQGAFDKRISLVRIRAALDEVGKPTTDGEEVIGHAWARSGPVSDADVLAFRSGAAEMLQFQIRWGSLAARVRAGDRLEYGGRRYRVLSAHEIGRRRYLEMKVTTDEA